MNIFTIIGSGGNPAEILAEYNSIMLGKDHEAEQEYINSVSETLAQLENKIFRVSKSGDALDSVNINV